jgi:hypothetical protein
MAEGRTRWRARRCSRQTVKRHHRFSPDGTWDKLLREIHSDADAAGQVVRDVSVDSSIVRAHQHSAGRVLRRARAAIGLG